MLSDQLIITIAGKKGGGKNTLGNFCVGYFLKETKQIEDFRIEKDGTLSILRNWFVTGDGSKEFINIKNGEFKSEDFNGFGGGVKLYSFADPLKQFCIDTLGLTFSQCYGTDAQKNELTHCIKTVTWNETNSGGGTDTLLQQKCMTAREVMQVFGTEFVRSLWKDAWSFATYKKIQDEGYSLAIITDARFKNEIDMGVQYGAKTIKLERSISTTDLHSSETALDDYPDNQFDTVIHNANMTIEEQNEIAAVLMKKWLAE